MADQSRFTVLLVYEYIITFGQDVQLFWRRKWSGATALFFLNRYLPLLGVRMSRDYS